MKPFEKWLTQEVEMTFDVKEVEAHPILQKWLEADDKIADDEWKLIDKYRQKLSKKSEYWNEDELKFQFIAPYLSVFNFEKEDVYTAFSQRFLATKINDSDGNESILRGRVEWFVAKGKQIPIHPVFFIHEYKPTLRTTPSDPKGQLLIAMYVSQILNKDDMPLYGAYVIGKDWYFLILKGKQYSVSRAYDVTQKEQIEQATKILKRMKVYIEDILG
jgi:hypothetical protein